MCFNEQVIREEKKKEKSGHISTNKSRKEMQRRKACGMTRSKNA